MRRRRSRAALAALFSLALSAAISAEPPAPKDAGPAPDYIISNVTIIDPASGQARPGQWVVVAGERIAGVYGGVPAGPDPARPVIDGTGLFLIPGLIDAHVHYIDPGTFGPMLVANGVTFVRDMGNGTQVALTNRAKALAGDEVGPRMIVSGAIVDGVPPIWPFSEPVDTPEAARAAVRKLKGEGVDFIKVYSLLKPEVYRAAVEEARALGLRAAGHIPAAVSVQEAVAAGQLTSEHMLALQPVILAACPPRADAPKPRPGAPSWADTTGWQRLGEADPAALKTGLEALRGMVQDPTVVVMEGIGRAGDDEVLKDLLMEYVPQSLRGFWSGPQYARMAKGVRPAVPAMIRFVGELHRAGVPLIVGTDLANPYVFAGFSLHREMEIFQEAGVPAPSVLAMATSTPAEVLGVTGDYGSVQAGKLASMVLLRADPRADIANTRAIAGVFLAGRYFDRAALDAMLADVREAVAAGLPAAAPAVSLELPGEVITRGRYVLTFTQGARTMPAGTEDFLITRTDDGYHVMSHTSPLGGWTSPTVVTLHAGTDWQARSAQYRELTKRPIEAAYRLDGAELSATATREGKPLPAQSLAAPAQWLLNVPGTAGSIAMLARADLEVGQRRAITSVAFGYPDWKLDTTGVNLRREPDTKVALGPPGAAREVPARLYVLDVTTPMGDIEQKFWTDERGLVLVAEVKLPFGVSRSELEVPAPEGAR